MMIGVAQVMGMKPILSAVFSSLPVSASASATIPVGMMRSSAASAVAAPIVAMKARRRGACGMIAFRIERRMRFS